MQNDGLNTGGDYEVLSAGPASGGQNPLREWRYRLDTPGLTAAEELAVTECLRSSQAPAGRTVHDFEQAFARLHGVKHAIGVANGTAALHLAFLAAEVGASGDDEVIQPSLNSVGAANMTVAAGGKPVFADIVSVTEPTISPDDAAQLTGPNTRVVVAMHYGGYSARMAELEALCTAQNLLLIEQVCYGPGFPLAELDGRAQGTIGKIGCFSLGAGNDVLGSESGMILTNDHEIAMRIRSQLWHGTGTLSPERNRARTAVSQIKAHGFSYRMDDARAALGLARLESHDTHMAIRQKRAQAYMNVVETFCDGAIEYVFGWAPTEGGANVSAILVEPAAREELRAFLTEKRIETGLHYPPVHTLSAFSNCRSNELSLTKAFADRVIKLPISADLPVMAPEHIIRLCNTYLDGHERAQGEASDARLRVA